MEANILVVEDEKGIRDAITIYLKNQGYYVYEAENGVQGLEMVENHTIHLAIVDIMMPVMDGITMTMKLREKYDFPLIFLSAKSEDIDKITGLNIGADDYITKPFSLKLVLMRIEAVLRRIKEKSEKQKILSAQGIELNKDSHEVYKNGAPVNLTQLEFELLLTFLNHKNQVLTRDNLIQQVWGYDFAGDEKTVNIHIMNLRRKLDTGCIHTIRGVGYKFESKN